MIKLHRMLLAGVILAAATSATQAADLNGQLVLGSSGTVTANGTDLATSTVISIPRIRASADGTGDFSGVLETSLLGTGLSIDTALAASGFGFQFSTAAFGSFVGDLGTIVTQNADFLNIYIEGNYTAGTTVVNSGRASLNVTLTFNNGQYGLTAVLNAPPTPIIPEPSSIALAGIGLASAGLFGLRKRYSK